MTLTLGHGRGEVMAITTPHLGGDLRPYERAMGNPILMKGDSATHGERCLVRDLAEVGQKNRFALTFDMLTDVQKGAVRSGVATVRWFQCDLPCADGNELHGGACRWGAWSGVFLGGILAGTELRWRGRLN